MGCRRVSQSLSGLTHSCGVGSPCQAGRRSPLRPLSWIASSCCSSTETSVRPRRSPHSRRSARGSPTAHLVRMTDSVVRCRHLLWARSETISKCQHGRGVWPGMPCSCSLRAFCPSGGRWKRTHRRPPTPRSPSGAPQLALPVFSRAACAAPARAALPRAGTRPHSARQRWNATVTAA